MKEGRGEGGEKERKGESDGGEREGGERRGREGGRKGGREGERIYLRTTSLNTHALVLGLTEGRHSFSISA